MGKKIGNASEDGGLYYFDEDTDEYIQAQTVRWESASLMRRYKKMLRHFRLGHPSFLFFKFLFASLFTNKDIFQCEVC